MDDGLFSLKIIGLYLCSLMKLIRVVEQNSLCEKKSEHQNRGSFKESNMAIGV